MSEIKKFILAIILTVLGCGFIFSTTHAQAQASSADSSTTTLQNENKESYFRARVTTILEEGKQKIDATDQPFQRLSLQILSGVDRDKQIEVYYGGTSMIQGVSRLNKGDAVIVVKIFDSSLQKDVYYISDFYRGTSLVVVVVIFFILAILFGRKKGIMAIIGMLFSAFILFYVITPRILQGGNPFVISVVGGILIIIFSLYLSHGFNKRTSVALVGSLLTLGLTIIFNIVFVTITKLSGVGSEEAFYLQAGAGNIDLKGLLLGGIIIGVLGVLDDVTTAQVASIEEVSKANPKLSFKELYASGLSVGREHIASLVNTLVLAYVGAAFPLILLYSVNKNLPLWVLINSNFIAEEVVRTVVGGSALVLAVPITTLIAAYVYRGSDNVSKDRLTTRTSRI